MNSNKNINNNHGSDQELDDLEELKHDGEIEHSQIVDYVDHLPEEETKSKLVELIAMRQQSFYSGPIPHWEDLKKYDEIIPNGADRIMKMAENQSTHRQFIEKEVIKGNNADSTKGVWFAGIIGIVGIVGAIILAIFDKNGMSIAIGGGTLASLVGVYLKGTNLDKEDLERKNPEKKSSD